MIATGCIIWLLRPLSHPTYYRCQHCRGWFNELGECSFQLPPGASYDPSPGLTCFECGEEQKRENESKRKTTEGRPATFRPETLRHPGPTGHHETHSQARLRGWDALSW